jgi:SAM-dependent methyltransferase
MSNSSPDAQNLRRGHPLAAELIARLQHSRASVLDVGAGSGRNTDALAAAGLNVRSVPDAQSASFDVPEQSFDAAIGTHAFLHGTPSSVTQMAARVARALKPGGFFYATFASKRDARYGKGTRIAQDAFAPESGDEAGVAHAYFDETGLRRALEPAFEIETLTEENVDAVVGRWAHAQRPSGNVHWFVRARKRQ